jgi:hypothetical protein
MRIYVTNIVNRIITITQIHENTIINLKIVNFYKPWSNMKILMLFHDFDVIGLLFHDFDIIGSVIP